MDDSAEVVGDVAERGHETELTEAGEESGECHADHGAIGRARSRSAGGTLDTAPGSASDITKIVGDWVTGARSSASAGQARNS